jgi:hypothetical protein
MGGCCEKFCAEFKKQRLAYDDFNQGEWTTFFGTSSVSCLQPMVYQFVQLVEALAIVGILIWSVYYENDCCNCGAKWFIFLTHWSLTLQLVYVWLSLFTTVRANALKEDGGSMPWYARLTWMLQDILLPLTFFVFILYFALILPAAGGSPKAISFFTHGANFVIMLLDMLLSRQPYYLLHGVYVAFFLAGYAIFTYVYHKLEGTSCLGNPYIYKAVDWTNATSTGIQAFFGILVVVPIVNLLFWLVMGYLLPRNKASSDTVV